MLLRHAVIACFLTFTLPVFAAYLDAPATLAAQRPDLARHTLPSVAMGNRFAETPSIKGLLRFKLGGLRELERLGITLHSVVGDVASVEVPLHQLAEVAASDTLVSFEVARPARRLLSTSVVQTGASRLRTGQAPNWTGATGKGVIVGIIDDGIDIRHADFRKPDGSTRLLAAWDQRESKRAGKPPASFSYGSECTAGAINSALRDGRSAANCLLDDPSGHGTHVAAIAAGNGSATGGGKPAFRYVGMAPEADLVVVNALDRDVTTSNAIVDALAYIKRTSKAAGKPAVVNMSFGSYHGPRDGTSNYERALSNAVEMGFMLVASAGNEAEVPVRVGGTIERGQTVSWPYLIHVGSQGEQAELWYPGADDYAVRVLGPVSGDRVCDSGWISSGSTPVVTETACGRLTFMSQVQANPENGDKQVLIDFKRGQSSLALGEWTIQLRADRADAASSYSLVGGEGGLEGSFVVPPGTLTRESLVDTTTASKVIGVGAYVTRTDWTSLEGEVSFADRYTLGDLARFSSRGPRRVCSNLAKCPPQLKPELVAPGMAVFSALSGDMGLANGSMTDPDGVHVAEFGTSMAAPHVSGAIALLLQRNPDLTPEEVRAALLGQTALNRYSGNLARFDARKPLPDLPDYGWGYGILDVAAAWQALPAYRPLSFQPKAITRDGLRTLSVTLTPRKLDQGREVSVYIVAQLPDGTLYQRHGSGWKPVSLPAPASAMLTLAEQQEISVYEGIKLTEGLSGTRVYVGFGADVEEMLGRGNYSLVDTLP